ncbi:MAG: hypothetical protein EOP56_07225 [Sphingobacteriales bacterium]|nr:MAG: hypothetical protein EOP56_07225 [Sphingobacteriales bacterium]
MKVAIAYVAVSPKNVKVKDPRADMFADTSLTVAGYPTYTNYVLSWVEKNDSLIAMTGPVRAAATGLTRHPICKVDSTVSPDVAAITDIAANEKIGGFVYQYGGGLYYIEKNFATGNIATPVSLTGSPAAGHARVEAMNLQDPALGGVRWQAVAPVYDAASGYWKPKYFNNLVSDDCVADDAATLGNVLDPVIAAVWASLAARCS